MRERGWVGFSSSSLTTSLSLILQVILERLGELDRIET